jgi:hypothetical protein
MADNSLKLFGFEITRSKKEQEKQKSQLPSIVPPTDDEGAGYVTAGAAGSHFGTYVDMDGTSGAKGNRELINKYRGIAMHPEVDTAIEEIVNEAITTSEKSSPVSLSLDEVDGMSDSVKKKINEEFQQVINMLNFNTQGHDIFRAWYIDGRMYHHLVVDEKSPKLGIQEIRYIDSTKIRKVKEVEYDQDTNTGAKVVKSINEFYIYEAKPNATQRGNAIKLSPDSVSSVTSGLMDDSRRKVVSYLHKCIKPVNQLRMMEDSLVIYRLARAPERRIFYIDVGNMQKGKAEEYMRGIMNRYRNKLVYDANSGEIKDDRKHMSMLEDFWLPRKEGGRGTEISTLPGGENLGQIDDILYFQKRLYKALNVPLSRLEADNQFSLGRSSEVTRDEIKFMKFIDRLRMRFNTLFMDILHKQCILKGVCTEQDWDKWKYDIYVDYAQDNHFTELKEAEILRERLQTVDQVAQYQGEFFSKEWVMKNVLRLSEDEIKDMTDQIEQERAENPDEDDL